jgi:hypothetical protein
MVEASGFIWLMKGHTKEPAPTADAAPVAMKSMSLRVGSTVDAFATIDPQILFVRQIPMDRTLGGGRVERAGNSGR